MIYGMVLLWLCSACQPTSPQLIQTDTANTQQITAAIALSQTHSSFMTNVPLLTEAHLDVDYWLQQVSEPDQVLFSFADIQLQNQKVRQLLPEVIDVFEEPEFYQYQQVRQMILELSHQPEASRFNSAGIELTAQHWGAYQDLLALPKILSTVQAQFALVTRRGSLRTFPTTDAVFSSATDQHLDRFQETAVFPGEPLQILHYSQDQQWAFVRHYHYNGWLATAHFALTEKSVAEQFVNTSDFILVTGDRIRTNFNAEIPQISGVDLEMGVKLPRIRSHAAVIHGQNSSFSYVVQLPVRQGNGQLQLVPTLIGKNQDVSTSYLALTPRNIIQQAFKFLGEPYGWGHSLNTRDCSGFIGEIYRTFGFVLPRNTSSQGKANFGAVTPLLKASHSQKIQALKQAQIGDLIFIPGHVMMVLGQQQGEVFVIHDVAGLHYFLPDGSMYDSMLNGVSVTPLSPLRRNQQESYIDSLYLIKSLSREMYENPAN